MKKWIFILLGLFLIVGVTVSIVYAKALKPLKTAEVEAIAAAEKKVNLRNVENVEIYNGEKTYYILNGTDENNQKIIVWVSEKGNDIVVKKEKDGLTRDQAVSKLLQEKDPQKIVSVKLGMLKNRQCWEIYYISRNNLINYYYVDFETGEWLRKIENM